MGRKFQNLTIYESRSVLFVVTSNSHDGLHDVLEIGRPLILKEDEKISISLLKEKVNDADLSTFMSSRKATLIFKNVSCLFGFVKLSVSYYLIAVTKSSIVADVHGDAIYCIQDVEMIPLIYKLRNTVEETRYKNVMTTYSLQGSFYFSYSYNLSQSLQNNILFSGSQMESQRPPVGEADINVQDRFVWNAYALQSLIALRDDPSKDSRYTSVIDSLIVPVIHGFVSHQSMSISTMTTVSNGQDGELVDNTSKGSAINYTLIARRSKHFAGTRYLRRGCNNCGDVANEVETEQILTVLDANSSEGPTYRSSSFVQLRGSIPLFWSHTNMFLPSPDIILEDHQAVLEAIANGTALPPLETALPASGRPRADSHERSLLVGLSLSHFQNLADRYRGTVHTISLIRRAESKREELIGQHFDEVSEGLRAYYVMIQRAGGGSVSDDSVNGTLSAEVSRVVKLTDLEVEELHQKHPEVILQPLINYVTYDMHGKAHDESIDAVFAYLDDLSYDLLVNSGFFVMAPSSRTAAAAAKKGGSEQYEVFGTGLTKSLFNQTQPGVSCIRVDPQEGEGGGGGSAFGKGLTVGALQCGVIRTNCIDCLDRTNIGQFAFAKTALYAQLLCLGVKVTSASLSVLQGVCMRSWSTHGDVMANQYGGSGAMHKIDDKASSVSGNSNHGTTSPTFSAASGSSNGSASGGGGGGLVRQSNSRGGAAAAAVASEECREFTLSGGTQNALVAVQRYYSNISTDFERQQCIDVLLGHFEEGKRATLLVNGQPPPPGPGPFVWELDQHPSRHRKHLPYRRLDLEQSYLNRLSACYDRAMKGELGVQNTSTDAEVPENLVSFHEISSSGSVNSLISTVSEQIDFVGCTILSADEALLLKPLGAASPVDTKPVWGDAEEEEAAKHFEGYVSSSTSAAPLEPSRLIERSVHQTLPVLPDDLTINVFPQQTNTPPRSTVGAASGDGLAAAAAKLKQQRCGPGGRQSSVVDWRYESLPKYSPSSGSGASKAQEEATPTVATAAAPTNSTSSGANSDVIGTAVVVGTAKVVGTAAPSPTPESAPSAAPVAAQAPAAASNSIFDFTSKWFFT